MIALNRDRCVGALIGGAAGDALGAPFEFGSAGQFNTRVPTSVDHSLNEMIGGGSFDGNRASSLSDFAIMKAHAIAGRDKPKDVYCGLRHPSRFDSLTSQARRSHSLRFL